MAIWRNGGFVDDIWTTLDDSAPIPGGGAIVVSFARWQAEKAALQSRADPVGVEIVAAKDTPERLAEAARRPLIALKFDKFADGRAFSYAELLRERHAFSGELRATGEVLLDEIALMQRCGFTSFEVTDANTLRALNEGRLPKGALFYQPALGPREAPAGTRPWLRRAAS
jgi:phosphoadenosine phosphosulfate reductase